MKIIGFIPSRYKSTRFPGKPLVNILGKPMIQRVYENAIKSELIDDIFVLTDDEKIYKTVKNFNGNVVYTSKRCSSGTDRIKSVLKKFNCDIAVNIQGDEPLICSKDIDKVVRGLLMDKNADISTLMRPIKEKHFISDPNIVKVIIDRNSYALYFSRYSIPYMRVKGTKVNYFQHIGLYAYRTSVLKDMNNLKTSYLENAEKLEQLRFLENGYKIKVLKTNSVLFGVDTPKDIIGVRSLLSTLPKKETI